MIILAIHIRQVDYWRKHAVTRESVASYQEQFLFPYHTLSITFYNALVLVPP